MQVKRYSTANYIVTCYNWNAYDTHLVFGEVNTELFSRDMVIYCVVSLIGRLRELISWCILKPRCHPGRMLKSSSPDDHGVYLFSIAWSGRWSELIKVI